MLLGVFGSFPSFLIVRIRESAGRDTPVASALFKCKCETKG